MKFIEVEYLISYKIMVKEEENGKKGKIPSAV
jgi:hypothetical protein